MARSKPAYLRRYDLERAMLNGDPIPGDPVLLTLYLSSLASLERFQGELAQHKGRSHIAALPSSKRRPGDKTVRSRSDIKRDIKAKHRATQSALKAYRKTQHTTYRPDKVGNYRPDDPQTRLFPESVGQILDKLLYEAKKKGKKKKEEEPPLEISAEEAAHQVSDIGFSMVRQMGGLRGAVTNKLKFKHPFYKITFIGGTGSAGGKPMIAIHGNVKSYGFDIYYVIPKGHSQDPDFVLRADTGDLFAPNPIKPSRDDRTDWTRPEWKKALKEYRDEMAVMKRRRSHARLFSALAKRVNRVMRGHAVGKMHWVSAKAYKKIERNWDS